MLGAATLPISGPMRFPDLSCQVYPLLADAEVLQRYLDWSCNHFFEPDKFKLELAGSYVYLTVATVGDEHGRMWSGSQNIGCWAEREVSFCIPVRWRLDGELVGLAMVEPLVFADKPRAVVTYREVNGRNAYQADIDSPPDAWLSAGGPEAPRRLVRVATESFIELGFGLETKKQPLIEIGERAPLPMSDLAGWRGVAEGWGRAYADELQRKAGAWRDRRPAIEGVQALSLEALARGAPLNRLTLKQYRDASEFDRACYQSIVQTQRRIERVHALAEIEQPVHIALHRRANYPIVEMLGLKVKHTQSGDSVVKWLEPVRPFYLRAAVAEDLGRIVATVDTHRAPGSVGEHAPRWFFPKAAAPSGPAPRGVAVSQPPSYFRAAGAAGVGAGIVAALREGDRSDLAGRLQTLSRRKLEKELHALRLAALSLPEDARAALPAVDLAADAFVAFLAAQPLARLGPLADALRAALPAWAVPASRVVRARELERLAGLALDATAPPQWLASIFAAPDRPTDASLRGADARAL